MANIAYQLNKVSTGALHPVLTQYVDESTGNKYVYLQGCSSVDSTHNWVTYDELGVTTLLAANAKGPVAVFLGACDATTKYGWAQVYGKCTVAGTDAVADNAILYIDATAGRADDAAVTGDLILGAITRSTDASTNIATVQLTYPYVNDILG